MSQPRVPELPVFAHSFLITLLLVLPGCSGIGPATITAGRAPYNEVINQTEDQQILSMIIRQRYDETFGMLAVSSVTASLRFQASAGANIGVGPDSSFEGNLVPLSAGVVYEDNPTISYIPLRGEQFVERMLGPITADHVILLSRMSTDQIEVLRLLVRRANGLANPLYASQAPPAADAQAFDRFIELYARLRETGRLDIVQSRDGAFQLLLHDYTPDESPMVGELLRLINPEQPGRPGHDDPPAGPVSLPLQFFVVARGDRSLDLETPSAFELIQAAGLGVEIPAPHQDAGLAHPALATGRDFITIHSASTRPRDALVATQHRGWWFYIDPRDARSKQGFIILRTLLGLRLDEAARGQTAPVLTVPVR